MMIEDNPLSQLEFDYHFSPAEVQVLARYFRSIQGELPDGLEAFAAAVEKAVYSVMSIDEAEAFYL